MTPVLELACPACRAPFAAHAGERVACPACAAPLLALVAGGPAVGAPGGPSGGPARTEYGRRPRLDAGAARRAFARLFETDGEPEPGPPPTSAELLFVPFCELSGTMAGLAADGRPVHRWAEAHLPACEDRDELGLAEIDAVRLEDVAPGEGLEREAPEQLAAAGSVLAAERDPDEMEAILAEEARIPADGEDALLVDRRVALLLYPVWLLRATVRGNAVHATVDGMTGTVLRARVPAKQRRRVWNGVLATACGGYVLGTMLRHEAMGLPSLKRAIEGAPLETLVPVLVLAALGLFGYALALNAAWNSLRYRNELVYHSGLKTRVLIGRPSETALDLLTRAVKTLWNRVSAPRRYDR